MDRSRTVHPPLNPRGSYGSSPSDAHWRSARRSTPSKSARARSSCSCRASSSGRTCALNCDPPWPPAIVYPAPFALAGGRARLPSEDVVHVLRALADETRLRALKLIAAGERSTQELAPLIGISEAGLSKHLRLLARAGLVRSRREGYYVLYSLESERISTLSEAVLSFLQETA